MHYRGDSICKVWHNPCATLLARQSIANRRSGCSITEIMLLVIKLKPISAMLPFSDLASMPLIFIKCHFAFRPPIS